MADVTFFDTPTIASLKKHGIVSKYVAGWANIVLPAAKNREGKIMYVDLFSGPGQYHDGAPSIPLLVLRHAIDTPALWIRYKRSSTTRTQTSLSPSKRT